jgi:hypothetical protein
VLGLDPVKDASGNIIRESAFSVLGELQSAIREINAKADLTPTPSFALLRRTPRMGIGRFQLKSVAIAAIRNGQP